MSNCPNCNAVLAPDDLFCGDCGSRIDEQPGVPDSKTEAGKSEILELATLFAVFGISLFVADAVWAYFYDNFPQYEFLGDNWLVYGVITILALVFAAALRFTVFRDLITVDNSSFLAIAFLCPIAFVFKFQLVPDGFAYEMMGLEPFGFAAESIDKGLFALLAAGLCIFSRRVFQQQR